MVTLSFYLVFSIVTLQLLVTFSIVCVHFLQYGEGSGESNIWTIFILLYYIIFLLSALLGRALVALSLSYMVGTVASFDNTAVVIIMGATVTRVDFTFCNGILLVLAMDLLMFSFFCCFYHSHVLQIVYGSLGALLFSLTQNSLNKYALDPEEYVFAALILSIINIFLYLLILMGSSGK
uniref:Uncharacterized protein n=1 Tax=Oncorhynchus kisutch TaxID=8019 RepID=A0A8C7G646_ONCKI